MKQGFTIIEIPSHTETVCNGCEFLETQAGVRGHKHCTNHFACLHPDVNTGRVKSFGMKGFTIAYNVEGNCITPSWCPFLSPKQNKL